MIILLLICCWYDTQAFTRETPDTHQYLEIERERQATALKAVGESVRNRRKHLLDEVQAMVKNVVEDFAA